MSDNPLFGLALHGGMGAVGASSDGLICPPRPRTDGYWDTYRDLNETSEGAFRRGAQHMAGSEQLEARNTFPAARRGRLGPSHTLQQRVKGRSYAQNFLGDRAFVHGWHSSCCCGRYGAEG